MSISNRAIAVVSFGTTYVDSAEKTIKAVEREVTESFKGYRVVSAYTSSVVRSSLLSRGIEVPSVEECLEALLADGVREATVLPTHLVGGEEYSKVVDAVRRYASRFDTVEVCRPLVEPQDVPRVVDAIVEVFDVPKGGFLVLMGHGSNTEANEAYHLMNAELAARGADGIYVATVESTPELRNAVDTVKRYHPDSVVLAPLMLVSGDHANHDMAIEWKSTFESAGFHTECVMKGIGEYPQFRRMYVDRVREVVPC